MTGVVAPVLAGARAPRQAGGQRAARLDACLGTLDDALAAADGLGLDTGPAAAVREEASRRLRLATDVYVLALVGGTGVGKSSLLNALAGRVVTAVGARRPTTGRPVAWVATSAAGAVAPLLERLGSVDRRLHDDQALAGVVILDLPDVDSLDDANRAAVDAAMPLVDAVAWVTDPEKYADALLHDALVRTWVPRLDHQLVLVNKVDRLAPGRFDEVRGHLARLLATELAGSGSGRPDVVASSAIDGAAGIAPFRAWLEAAIDAKAVVTGRLAATAADAVLALTRAAGVDGDAGREPLLDPVRRRRALDAAAGEALRVLDLRGAERQAVAATRARARRRGSGPMGRLTAMVHRVSGHEGRVADPGAYLAGWRRRGTLAGATEPVTDAVLDALAGTPAALCPTLAAASDPGALAGRLEHAVDRVVAAHRPFEAPTSRAWTALGILATGISFLLVFAVAWLLIWIVGRPPADSLDLPVIGPVPMPFALLAGALLAGLVPSRLLALHAGWLGRRWAGALTTGLRDELQAAVDETAFGVVDRVESSRRALWLAGRAAEARCR